MTAGLAQPGFSTTVEALWLRNWSLGADQPVLVLDRFGDEDFKLVVDDRADVHINSKDGRFYLGWFPGGRPGAEREGWGIAVAGTAAVPGYHVFFDTETPAEVSPPGCRTTPPERAPHLPPSCSVPCAKPLPCEGDLP
ncbi:DUF317 domain-containing protein [Streptomyces sp. KL2]|uniref:DUF317 domain-containing protein n=1 Tax=Streptomyces sp. KL2 TaxID=3050126 RepID=UPI0039789DFF